MFDAERHRRPDSPVRTATVAWVGGLAGRRRRGFAQAGPREHLPGGQRRVQVVVAAVGAGRAPGRRRPGVTTDLTHGERGQAEGEGGVGKAEQERAGGSP
jgi:hypothetical protein